MWYALSGGLLVRYESTPDEVRQQQWTRKNAAFLTKPSHKGVVIVQQRTLTRSEPLGLILKLRVFTKV